MSSVPDENNVIVWYTRNQRVYKYCVTPHLGWAAMDTQPPFDLVLSFRQDTCPTHHYHSYDGRVVQAAVWIRKGKKKPYSWTFCPTSHQVPSYSCDEVHEVPEEHCDSQKENFEPHFAEEK